MIKNIIFDIGNVLVDYCWREHIAGCGFAGETAERLGNAMMKSPVWNEVDRGAWSDEELLTAFIANDPELAEEIRKVFSDLGTIVGKREGSKPWIRSLKEQGYKVYYLSNFAERVKREASDRLSFLEEMDGGLMSYEVHLIKPDEAIYRALFERCGIRPEESIFLDDSPANLETAKVLGMEGLLVRSQEQAVVDLQNFLEKIKG